MFDGPQRISPRKHDLFVALESRLLQSNQQQGRKLSDKTMGVDNQHSGLVSLDLATATLELQVGVLFLSVFFKAPVIMELFGSLIQIQFHVIPC